MGDIFLHYPSFFLLYLSFLLRSANRRLACRLRSGCCGYPASGLRFYGDQVAGIQLRRHEHASRPPDGPHLAHQSFALSGIGLESARIGCAWAPTALSYTACALYSARQRKGTRPWPSMPPGSAPRHGGAPDHQRRVDLYPSGYSIASFRECAGRRDPQIVGARLAGCPVESYRSLLGKLL